MTLTWGLLILCLVSAGISVMNTLAISVLISRVDAHRNMLRYLCQGQKKGYCDACSHEEGV
jgi:hypothetical protein